MKSLVEFVVGHRERVLRPRIDLACGCYTEGLHSLVSLREDIARGQHRSALRSIRPVIQSSLRSLYAVYVSTDKQIARNSFPGTLVQMAERIEQKQPQYGSMFSLQLTKRKDSNGYTVDRLANGWAHSDISLIRPYCRPGALEQCCALWTAENFLAFAQAICFALDPELTPASPYAPKYY